MPIYEFYCPDCHTLFSFLSRAPNTRKRPACPSCKRPKLERRVSAFAISTGRSERGDGEDLPEGLDEQRMQHVMAEMADDVEGMNEDDPRQMARMMRKLFDGTGMPVGAGMEEAIRRMESGENPDKIEEEMGDLLEGEESMLLEGGSPGSRLRRLREQLAAPRKDETLYEM